MAGVVIVNEFSVPQSSGGGFKTYLDYIGRSNASKEENISGYLDYMDDPIKTSNLFSENEDELSLEQKKLCKEAFDKAEENGSLMWQTVISFDNNFLEENGLYDSDTQILDEKKIKAYTRGAISQMLKNEGLAESAVWTGSIHYNTDNLHIHIATVEPQPMREKVNRTYVNLAEKFLKENNIEIPSEATRQNVFSDKAEKEIKDLYFKCRKALGDDYKLSNTIFVQEDGTVKIAIKSNSELPNKKMTGVKITGQLEPKGRFKQSSLNKAKSHMVNEIINSKEMNSAINNIIRKNIIEAKKNNSLVKDNDLAQKFIKIYAKLPSDKRMWRYNMSAIDNVRPLIDELSEAYINKYHKEDFAELKKMLEEQEKAYEKAYGEKSPNNMAQNKIDDLYARLGNTILKEIKDYDYNKSQSSKGNFFILLKNQSSKSIYENHNLENALRKMKKYLNKDFQSVKNQNQYNQLQKQLQNEEEYEM